MSHNALTQSNRRPAARNHRSSIAGSPIHFTLPSSETGYRPADGFSALLNSPPPSGEVDPAAIYAPGDLLSFSGSFRVSLYRPMSELMSKNFFGLTFSSVVDSDQMTASDQVLSHFSLVYDDTLGAFIASDFAYNPTVGASLTVVPEPVTLTSLAVGSAGLLTRRRRRQ